MTTLEGRIKQMNNSAKRRHFIEDIFEEVQNLTKNSDDIFPYSCVIALDKMLKDVIDTKPEKLGKNGATKITILDAEFSSSVNPVRMFKGGIWENVYNKVILGKTFYIYRYFSEDDVAKPIYLYASLTDKELKFSFELNGERISKVKNLKKNLQCSFVTPEIFSNSLGVSIRKANAVGAICLLGNTERFGVEHAGKYVLSFFANGINYHFDVFGNMLFEPLDYSEQCEQKRLEKAFQFKDKMKNEDLETLSEKIMDKLRESWYKNPVKAFKNPFNTYILNGEVRFSVHRKLGFAQIVNFKNGKVKKGIYVAKLNMPYYADMVIRGRYVIAYKSGDIINGYYFPKLLKCGVSLIDNQNELSCVSLKPLSSHILTTTLSDWTYSFLLKEANEKYGQHISSVGYKALLINQITKNYELLLFDEVEGVSIIPLTPNRIKPSKKYILSGKTYLEHYFRINNVLI